MRAGDEAAGSEGRLAVRAQCAVPRRFFEPSKKLTVPVAVPDPPPTVAVMLTGWPKVDGLTSS